MSSLHALFSSKRRIAIVSIVAIAIITAALQSSSTSLTGVVTTIIKPPSGSSIGMCFDADDPTVSGCPGDLACRQMSRKGDQQNPSHPYYLYGDIALTLHDSGCKYGRHGPDYCGCFECASTYDLSPSGESCICPGEYYVPSGVRHECSCSADAEQCPGTDRNGNIVCCEPPSPYGGTVSCTSDHWQGVDYWRCAPIGIIVDCPDGTYPVGLSCECLPGHTQCGDISPDGGGQCCPSGTVCDASFNCVEALPPSSASSSSDAVSSAASVVSSIASEEPSSSSVASEDPSSASAISSEESSSALPVSTASTSSDPASESSSSSATEFDPEICCEHSTFTCKAYDPEFPTVGEPCVGPKTVFTEMTGPEGCLNKCHSPICCEGGSCIVTGLGYGESCPSGGTNYDALALCAASCTPLSSSSSEPSSSSESSSSESSSSSEEFRFCCFFDGVEPAGCNPHGTCDNPAPNVEACNAQCGCGPDTCPSSSSSSDSSTPKKNSTPSVASESTSVSTSDSSSSGNPCGDDCIYVTCCKDNLCKPNMTCDPYYIDESTCRAECVECTTEGCSVSSSSSSSDESTSMSAESSCPPCEAPPHESCVGTGECGCGPYICSSQSSESSNDGGNSGDNGGDNGGGNNGGDNGGENGGNNGGDNGGNNGGDTGGNNGGNSGGDNGGENGGNSGGDNGGDSGGNNGGNNGGGNGGGIDARCGDGVIQQGEQCERGEEYLCTTGKVCDTNSCTCFDTTPQPYCGDGLFQPGEQCDIGIDQYCLQGRVCNTNLCTCVPQDYQSFCGNGVREGNEQCDDGNRRNNDGCTVQCTIDERFSGCISNDDCIAGACINGSCRPCFIHEECSDGICQNGQCQKPTIVASTQLCSNGILETSEECDDGNRIDGDGCNRYCLIEKVTQVEAVQTTDVSLVASEHETVAKPQPVPRTVPSVVNAQLLQHAAPQQFQFPAYPTQNPTPYQLPLAQLQPLIQSQGPVGQTGPAAVAIIGAGAAAGMGWIRRKRR